MQGALHSLGFAGVHQVRMGKYLEVQIDAPNQAAAAKQAMGWTAAPFEIPEAIAERWRAFAGAESGDDHVFKNDPRGGEESCLCGRINTQAIAQIDGRSGRNSVGLKLLPQRLIHDFIKQLTHDSTSVLWVLASGFFCLALSFWPLPLRLTLSRPLPLGLL